MSFLAFYITKGFKLEYLLNLDMTEKLFMIATMELEIQRQVGNG